MASRCVIGHRLGRAHTAADLGGFGPNDLCLRRVPITAHSVRSADPAKAGARTAGNLKVLIGRVIQARLRWWPQSAAA